MRAFLTNLSLQNALVIPSPRPNTACQTPKSKSPQEMMMDFLPPLPSRPQLNEEGLGQIRSK